jgi:hypothetical protein
MDLWIPFAVQLAPQIGRWLFGSKGEQTAAAVAQVVHSVTGTTDVVTAQRIVTENAGKADQLRLELAKLAAEQEEARHQADLDVLKAQLRDIVDGVTQTVGLAKGGSGIAWGGAAVSVVVLVTFGMVMWAILTHTMPAGSEGVLNVLLGMLGTGFAAVTNYWLGSSVGSLQKTTLLAMSSQPGAASLHGGKL